jgi:hypothetical protein
MEPSYKGRSQLKGSSLSRAAVGSVIFCLTAGGICGLGFGGPFAFLLSLLTSSLYFIGSALKANRNPTPAIVFAVVAFSCILVGLTQGLFPEIRKMVGPI